MKKKLADNEYFKHVVDWLRYHITSAKSTTRMAETLKALFQPEAIAACRWKGAKGKVALKDCSKICLLFETVGSTTKFTVTHLGVNNFLVSNFRYGEYNIKRKKEREALANAEANNDWEEQQEGQ